MKIMILECVSSLAPNYWSPSQALASCEVEGNIDMVSKCDRGEDYCLGFRFVNKHSVIDNLWLQVY